MKITSHGKHITHRTLTAINFEWLTTGLVSYILPAQRLGSSDSNLKCLLQWLCTWINKSTACFNTVLSLERSSKYCWSKLRKLFVYSYIWTKFVTDRIIPTFTKSCLFLTILIEKFHGKKSLLLFNFYCLY